jgi:hypothetical protein
MADLFLHQEANSLDGRPAEGADDNISANNMDDDGTIPCLLCDTCQMPLCSLSDIILDRVAVMDKAVYSYEMDLLGEEDVWLYSATNPSARRFDVVRVSASMVGMRTVRCDTQFSTDHTWFPPYAWCMCECSSCGRHVGWGFKLEKGNGHHKRDRDDEADDGAHQNSEEPVFRSRNNQSSLDENQLDTVNENCDDDDDDAQGDCNGIAFVGLIVTYCKPAEEYSLRTFHELVDTAAEREQQQQHFKKSLRDLFRILPRIQNQLVANQLAMQLMQMPFQNRQNVVDGLLVAARALLEGNGGAVGDHSDASDDGETSDDNEEWIEFPNEEDDAEEEEEEEEERDSGDEAIEDTSSSLPFPPPNRVDGCVEPSVAGEVDSLGMPD